MDQPAGDPSTKPLACHGRYGDTVKKTPTTKGNGDIYRQICDNLKQFFCNNWSLITIHSREMPYIICVESSVSWHHLTFILENSKKINFVFTLKFAGCMLSQQQFACWKVLCWYLAIVKKLQQTDRRKKAKRKKINTFRLFKCNSECL